MANRHKAEQQPDSHKTDDQIINDLIENRKRQMEALIKIMSSMEEGEMEAVQSPKKKKGSSKKK